MSCENKGEKINENKMINLWFGFIRFYSLSEVSAGAMIRLRLILFFGVFGTISSSDEEKKFCLKFVISSDIYFAEICT